MEHPWVREDLVETPQGLELHLFLRKSSVAEFAAEPGAITDCSSASRLTDEVTHYAEDQYPDKPIKKIRVFLGTLLMTTVALTGAGAGAAQATAKPAKEAASLSLVVNGSLQSAANPVLLKGSTMVDAKALASVLGAQYSYDSEAQTVTFRKSANTVTMRVGQEAGTVNGRMISAAPPQFLNSTLYVPVRQVSEGLQAVVAWDPQRQTVLVTTDPSEVYTVRAGDSLFTIALANKTTVDTLLRYNRLGADAQIEPGIQLLVPRASDAYVVQQGDSLFEIAARYQTSVAAIKSASGLQSDTIVPGQKLTVPSASAATATSNAAQTQENVQPTDKTAAAFLQKSTFRFPLPSIGNKAFNDTWGDSRAWTANGGAKRAHEGTDIFAPAGTPVVAVGDGTIINYGWNEYGGWRITVKLDNAPYAVYYAHLSRYAPGLSEGARVHAGMTIGYVGSTGYGPPGTSGKFDSHLHVGVYDTARGFEAINPYPFLKYWQDRL